MKNGQAGFQAERYRPELIDEDPFGDDLDVEGTDPELFQPEPCPEWEESGPWRPAPRPDEEGTGWDSESYDSPEPYSGMDLSGAPDRTPETFGAYSAGGGESAPLAAAEPDTGAAPGVRPRRNGTGKGQQPESGPDQEAGANPEPGSWNFYGEARIQSRGGTAAFVGTAAATAALSAALPEEGGEEIRNMPVYIARTRRGFRVVRAGGKLARSGVHTVGRIASRIGAAVSKLAQKAASSALVKALAAHAALPAVLLLLGLLLMAVLVTSPFATKSSPEDMNDVWLYVTRLDAAQEQRIRAACRTDMEVQCFVNGFESTDIHVRTDLDYLLLYLDAAYETASLSASISGFFGGATVQAEIDAIHGLLYSCDVQDIVDHTEVEDSGLVDIYRREVHVSIQSLRGLLASIGAVSGDVAEVMDGTVQAGQYAALEALGSPFGTPCYARDRWGWYVDSAGLLRRREAVELVPPAGNGTVYACLSGTVEAAAGNSVTVSSVNGPEITYTGLSSISVAPGQQVERGERLGSVPYYTGSLWLECRVGDSTVNPMFYLPHPSWSGSTGIVDVALTQLGNEGGELFWRWYGFPVRVEWCACFVSWCADQCGLLDAGVLPRFSSCTDGIDWFSQRGLWRERDYIPAPGDLIFFDWELDGEVNHVGIVERIEEDRVYTVEGNSGNRCKENSYSLTDSRIFGYGVTVG